MSEINTAAAIRRKNADWQFPDFKEKQFTKKASKYAVCVFVINEGKKIQQQIKKMEKYSSVADIIIADGGSSDGSLEDNYLRAHKVRALLVKTGPGKLSAQMRMAFAWALDQGYEGVVVVDGNDKDDVSAIPHFIDKLREGYDHIQGSRFIKGGRAVNTPLERLLAVRLIHSPLISLAARYRYTDTTNGFRAYSRRLLTDPGLNIFRDIFSTYELHYYLAIEAARAKKYKIIEIPVARAYPKKGKTPTKISPIKGNLNILIVLIRAIFRTNLPDK